jgi:hypothetical protein
MFSRIATHLTRCGSISLRNSRLIYPLNPCRRLFELPRRGQIRPWYRRFWPLTITLTVGSASIPIGYIIYRDFLRDQLWMNRNKSSEENFDENTESVSQSELDTLISQAQQLLNSELYLNRSSIFIVPIRLFFRTLKLIIIFTPVIIFYFFQNKFAPQLYEKWCFTLKRSVFFFKNIN